MGATNRRIGLNAKGPSIVDRDIIDSLKRCADYGVDSENCLAGIRDWVVPSIQRAGTDD